MEYMFLLDPTETYTNVFQFESDLSSFFESKGMCIKAVSPVNGFNGKRMLMIEKKEEIETTDNQKEKSVLQQKAQLGMIRGVGGKWGK